MSEKPKYLQKTGLNTEFDILNAHKKQEIKEKKPMIVE